MTATRTPRKLFSPVQIGPITLQHRVVMAPLTRSRSVQPGDIPGDLMVEYKRRTIALKANLTNLTDEHYADTLYRGHYIPGKPRTLEVTATMNFQDRP